MGTTPSSSSSSSYSASAHHHAGGGGYGVRKGRGKGAPAEPKRIKGKVLFDGLDTITPTDSLTVHNKSLAHRKQLETYLRRSYLFEALQADEMQAVIDAFEKKVVVAGTEHPLMSQGDAGEWFYVVHQGTFRYSKDSEQVGEYVQGESFGEMALLHNTVRDMTVVAVSNPASVWTIDRATFRRTMAVVQRAKRVKLMHWFDRVPMLSKLKPEETLVGSTKKSLRLV